MKTKVAKKKARLKQVKDLLNARENIVFRRITPTLAKKILGLQFRFGYKNPRRLSERRLQDLIYDMKSGAWTPEASDAIKFDASGRLIDGWHRIKAVVSSRKAIESIVTFGAPTEAAALVNTGRPVNLAAQLKILGLASKYHAGIAGFLRIYNTHLQDGQLGKSGTRKAAAPTITRAKHLLKILDKERLYKAANLAYGNGNNPLRCAEAMYVAYIALGEDEAKAEAFFNGLCKASRSFPSRVRKKILDLKHFGPLTQEVKWGILMKAWTQFRDGKTRGPFVYRFAEEKLPKVAPPHKEKAEKLL